MTIPANVTILGKANLADQYIGVNAATKLVPLQKAHTADIMDLSPEGLVQFFGIQMQQSRGRLEALLQQQEARNSLIQDYQAMEGLLSKYSERGIHPSDPDWQQFCQLATKLEGTMAGSEAEKQLAGMWDGAMAPTLKTDAFGSDKAAAEAFASAHGTQVSTTVIPTGFGKTIEMYTVTTNTGDPPGTSKENVQSMISQLKGIREGLSSDNTINMIRVQNEASVMTQISSACTNLVQKFHEARIGIIQNYK